MDKHDLSQAQFAEYLGVSPKVFARFFKSDSNPKIKDIVLWAKKLDVKVKDLLEDDGKMDITVTRPSSAIKSIKASGIKIKKIKSNRRKKMSLK